MAPELFNHEDYDFECDVWSTGIIMHALLTKG